MQHIDGHFERGGFHAKADEFSQVWAAKAPSGTGLPQPPCVYYSMEAEDAEPTRSDYVECYDRQAQVWYELELPGGPYWMFRKHVIFWDLDGDGIQDFAVEKEDGTWSALTFVRQG